MNYNKFMDRNTVCLQGLNIDTFDINSALEYACNISGQVVTLNPEMVINAGKNPAFASIINKAELVIPDGVGVELGLKILGHNVKRIAGIEFSRKLIDLYAKAGRSIAFVGAKPEILEKAIQNLKAETPEIEVAYAHDGYFKDDEQILSELKNVNPALVFVALGSPKQEEFIAKAKTIIPAALMIGVGGSFDVWSGVVQRAPKIYQVLCIEWLYRTVKDPKRFKRIFPTLPLFVLKVFKEKLFGRV